MPFDPPIVGRPTILWLLETVASETMRCEVGELEDGGMSVRIIRDDAEYASGMFTDLSGALRWAFSVQATLLEEGWRRTHRPHTRALGSGVSRQTTAELIRELRRAEREAEALRALIEETSHASAGQPPPMR